MELLEDELSRIMTAKICPEEEQGKEAQISPAAVNHLAPVVPPETKALKVVLFLDHTAKMGGGEIALLSLVCALDPQRYRPVVVLASEGSLSTKLREANIETRIVPLEAAVLNTRKDSLGLRSLLHLREIRVCLRYVACIARLARQLDADLIHTNSLKSDIYGGLAGRLARIPVIWHVRDRIDHHYLPATVAAAFRFLSCIIPQAVVANSESTLQTLRLPRRKLTAVVYSGLAASHVGSELGSHAFTLAHPPRCSAPPDINCEPGGAVISLIGRIAEWKGQHIFLRAAAEVHKKFPETRFQIIGAPLFGEEAYEASLHQMAAQGNQRDRIAFLGFRDDIPQLLAASDIVVHASTLGEPFGQVVVEGMAAGKPIIATNGGALPEIVVPGVTGLLVPMGDARAMAEGIMQLLADPRRAQTMGLAGRQRVRERFLISHSICKVHCLYDRLLKSSILPK